MNAFFRPTAKAIVVSLFVTGLSVAAIIYTFDCALDGNGRCFQIPAFFQAVIIALLWPWIVVARLFGPDLLALSALFGILLSLLWVFLIVCIVRGIGSKIKRLRQKA